MPATTITTATTTETTTETTTTTTTTKKERPLPGGSDAGGGVEGNHGEAIDGAQSSGAAGVHGDHADDGVAGPGAPADVGGGGHGNHDQAAAGAGGPGFGDESTTSSGSTTPQAFHDMQGSSSESSTTPQPMHDAPPGGDESSTTPPPMHDMPPGGGESSTTPPPMHDEAPAQAEPPGGGGEIGSAANAAIATTTWGFMPIMPVPGKQSDSQTGDLGAPAADVGGTAKGDPHLVNIKGEAFDVRQPGKHALLRVPRDPKQSTLLSVHARVESDWQQPCNMLITHVEVSGAWLGPENRVWVRALRRRSSSDALRTEVQQRILPGHPVLPFAIKVGRSPSWTPLWKFAGFRGAAGNVSIEAAITNRNRSQVWGAHNAAGYFKIVVHGAEIRLIQKRPAWGFLNVDIQHLQRLSSSLLGGGLDIGGLLGADRVPERLGRATDECVAHQSRRKRRRFNRQLAEGQKGLSHDALTVSPGSLTNAEGAQSVLVDVERHVVGSSAVASLE